MRIKTCRSVSMEYAIPNTIEDEKRLLSALMINDGEGIPATAEQITEDDFYRVEHKLVYAAILKAYESGHCDPLLVEDELRKAQTLGKVTLLYFYGLIDQEYTTLRIPRYIKKIKEQTRLRKLQTLGRELVIRTSKGLKTSDELVAMIDQRLNEVLTQEEEHMTLAVDGLVQAYEDAITKSDGVIGIETGFYDLDKITGGLRNSDLIILAARPAMGKTALAMNIAANASKKVSVLVFSLEMSKEQLFQRILSATSRVEFSSIRNRKVSNDDLEYLLDALKLWDDRKLFVDDTGGLALSEMRMRARRIKKEHELGLIVVDYLQLIHDSGKYKNNRVQEVSEISRGLKELAKELNVPVLSLSQLSRNVELRADKKPQLSDLRESGAIEQDADIVMFLYRDEYYNRDTEDDNLAELIIAKNRNGATGSITMQFEPKLMLFRDLTRVEE